jgi:phosphatidylinositol alpha-mannosyltransferase
MRIGIVCPYSMDMPGGVQNHIKDLAEALIGLGHEVSVLAPSETADLPPYVVSAGRAVPIPYNGAVGYISFGPVASARVRRWLREGDFDVVHLHEPGTPSLSLLALWAAEVPVVATFHMSHAHSRAVSATATILRPTMEKVAARIAVSELARDTVVHHVGGEPVVIPNGLYVERFRDGKARPEWEGETGTVLFLGRIDEARKGFPVLAAALAELFERRPGTRVLVLGGGDIEHARALVPESVRGAVTFLGRADDDDRLAALTTADVYVAPNTGAESFGIVLIEAMAAGTTVLASDIPAFRRMLDDGRNGALFRSEDSADLAKQLVDLLEDPQRRSSLRAAAAAAVRRYDWSVVAGEIVRVYETVTGR